MIEFNEKELDGIPEEYRKLFLDIADSITKLISDRKLKYISDTSEFSHGVTVGIEVGAMYGAKLYEIYEKFKGSDITSTD